MRPRQLTHRQRVGEIWRQLFSPFKIPVRLHDKVCLCWENVWQGIDIDMAGCKMCGTVHDCQNSGGCMLETDNCSSVCTITGYCVAERVYADTEFTDTVILVSNDSPKPKFVEYEAVYMHISKILCSEDARQCLEQEKTKVSQKLQYLMYKVMREEKQLCRGVPNLFKVMTLLAAKSQNIRICPCEFDIDKRVPIAKSAAKSVTRLICALHNIYPTMFKLMRVDIIVVGLLYLMRSGLVLHGTTILPCIQDLNRLLPLESYLYPCFQIKCKTITEVENVVKMHIRSLNRTQLSNLGMNSIDQIIPN